MCVRVSYFNVFEFNRNRTCRMIAIHLNNKKTAYTHRNEYSNELFVHLPALKMLFINFNSLKLYGVLS